jgi:hypothetical protein
LNRIPDNSVVKFIENVSAAIFNHDPCFNFDYKKNFINWGDSIQTVYHQILYPSDISAATGQQVALVQQFVANAVKLNKRIRGAGTRHSWSNIFSDPGQLLVSFYPYKVAKGTSRVVEDWARQMTEVEEVMAYKGIEHLCLIRKVGEIDSIE